MKTWLQQHWPGHLPSVQVQDPEELRCFALQLENYVTKRGTESYKLYLKYKEARAQWNLHNINKKRQRRKTEEWI